MQAIDRLMEAHGKIRTLFKAIARTKEEDIRQREENLKELKIQVETLARMKEKVLYPTCELYPSLKNQLKISREDVHLIQHLLQEVCRHEVDTEMWFLAYKAFQELLENHMSQDEKYLFPEILRVFPQELLEEVGDELLVQSIAASHPYKEGWEIIMHANRGVS